MGFHKNMKKKIKDRHYEWDEKFYKALKELEEKTNKIIEKLEGLYVQDNKQ